MPRITIQADQYEQVYAAIKRTPESRNKSIVLKINKRLRPIRKNDILHIYWRNIYTKRYEKIGILKCKKEETQFNIQVITLLTTYDRKYYLNRQVKKAGFKLELEQTSKTISVSPEMTQHAQENKALKELSENYNYGVQYSLI